MLYIPTGHLSSLCSLTGLEGCEVSIRQEQALDKRQFHICRLTHPATFSWSSFLSPRRSLLRSNDAERAVVVGYSSKNRSLFTKCLSFDSFFLLPSTSPFLLPFFLFIFPSPFFPFPPSSDSLFFSSFSFLLSTLLSRLVPSLLDSSLRQGFLS